jgi:peptidoglycan hydrolase-like protein with peptidoglycan-binding domain
MKILAASAALAIVLCAGAPIAAYAQSAPAAATAEQTPVGRAQARLKELGIYSGDVTGQMNRATERAIDRFQSRNNLAVTGTLTPETMSVLFHES